MNALPQPREFSSAIAGEIMETVLLKGDLRYLNPAQRLEYCAAICQSTGLNPLTKPFEYIELNGKLTLYALKTCTDQLRQIHGVSIAILAHKLDGDLYTVHVKARDREGREDEDFGVVYMAYPQRIKKNGNWIDHPKAGKPLEAEDRANAILKAVTKAKRRVTLSICGLGMLDETEVEDIPASAKREPQEIDAVAPPESEASAAPTRQKRRRGVTAERRINDRYEAEIRSDKPRRAFDPAIQAEADPEVERRARKHEMELAADFMSLQDEIRRCTSVEGLRQWYDDNTDRVFMQAEDRKNVLRSNYANKLDSLKPHSISQRAMAARKPPGDPQDGLDIPDWLRRDQQEPAYADLYDQAAE